MVVAPDTLTDKQLFAIDQFLMQGGTVVVNSGAYKANYTGNNLNFQGNTSNIKQWLQHHGFTIDNRLLLDPKNLPFPVPVTRNLGAIRIQEMRMLPYPYFPDVRDAGLNSKNIITASLPQVTLSWPSAINIKEGTKTFSVTELLTTSSESWQSASLDIAPRLNNGQTAPYIPEGIQKSTTIGLIAEGTFTSYFKDKPSPLSEDKEDTSSSELERITINSTLEQSPDSARIILYSSNDFMQDRILEMMAIANKSNYLNSLQLVANTLSWVLEDEGLLSIRSRGNFNQTLPPMTRDEQVFWEYANYLSALALLLLIALIRKQINNVKQRRFQLYL